jgi:hypothetical protein
MPQLSLPAWQKPHLLLSSVVIDRLLVHPPSAPPLQPREHGHTASFFISARAVVCSPTEIVFGNHSWQ